MTPNQLQKIKTDMAADPVFSTLPQNADTAVFIADEYNLPATPDYWVYRTTLAEKEIYEATSSEGTTWDWTTYMAQTVQERDAWGRMFGAGMGMINPSLAQVRAAFAKIFSGNTAAQIAQRNHLLAMARELASRGEKLLATGTGSTGAPALMTFEGLYRGTDIEQAWALE